MKHAFKFMPETTDQKTRRQKFKKVLINTDVVRMTFIVPKAIHLRFKIASIRNRKKMTDIVMDAIMKYLETHEANEEK